MYEPETNPEIAELLDHERLTLDDSDNTPIFHALVRRSADPVEHFRRDPLHAPLPAHSLASGPPVMTRMLLHSVPSAHGEQSGGRHRWGATNRADRPGGDPAGSDAPAWMLSARPRRELASRGRGRHRVLRAVSSGSPDR